MEGRAGTSMKDKVYIIAYGRMEWSGRKEDNADTIRGTDAQDAVRKFKQNHRGEYTQIRQIYSLDGIGRKIIERIEAPEDCFGGMA